MKTIAIILAGGKGTRFGGNVPKQFLPMSDGLTVLQHSLEVFQGIDEIDTICVVAHRDFISMAMSQSLPYPKVNDIIEGGNERYESTLNALKVSVSPDDVLLIHDAARPYLSADVVRCCLEAMKDNDAVGVALHATDTVWQADKSGHISSVPDRSALYLAQTPQCFRSAVIKEAFGRLLANLELSENEGNSPASDKSPANIPVVTDDCSVVLKYMPEVPVKIIEGDPANKKITFCDDL